MSVAERMPTDAKHRKSRAKEAIAGLVDKKYLGMKGVLLVRELFLLGNKVINWRLNTRVSWSMAGGHPLSLVCVTEYE